MHDEYVNRPFVVERPRRKIRAQHLGHPLAQNDADRRRETVEQFGCRGDAVPQRHRAAEIQRIDPRAQTRLEFAPQPVGHIRPTQRRARKHDAGEPSAAQPILVVHRRLMHEIGQVVVFLDAVVRKKSASRRGRPPWCCNRRRYARGASRLPARLRPSMASTALIRLTVARSTIPGVRAGRFARAFVAFDDVAARDGDHILAAALGGAMPRNPRHLRVLDLERRRLPDLPSNQLIEILRLGRNLSNRTSDSLPTVSGSTSATRLGRDGSRSNAAGSRRSAPPSCMLTAFRPASTTPSGSGSPASWSTHASRPDPQSPRGHPAAD